MEKKRWKTTLAPALTVALTGCQATQRQNTTTGESKTNAATQGALIGAIAGAVAGAATGDSKDRSKRALIGAAVGGGIDYYFDRQEATLREELMNSGVQLERVGENNFYSALKMASVSTLALTRLNQASTIHFVALLVS